MPTTASPPPSASPPPTALRPPPAAPGSSYTYEDTSNNASSYLYGGDMGKDGERFFNGNDVDFEDFDEDGDAAGFLPNAVLIGVLLIGLCVCLWLQRRPMLNAWHRRQARLAFSGGPDAEMRPVASWFATTSTVRVAVELDGQAHTIGASRETFGQGLAQLPFALTDACAESDFPELRDLDIVDLCIAKRCELRYEAREGGALQLVDAHTTLEDVMMAKSFAIKVLPAPEAS